MRREHSLQAAKMNKKPLKTKLGKRLRYLYEQIPENTEIFYDLCCDHGALGRAVLESYKDCQVIFNDIHPDIMARLEDQLRRLAAENFRLEICPAENIQLDAHTNACVMLAGVGDGQCICILAALLAQPINPNTRFIVSPATKVLAVRDYLRQQNINCFADTIISENKRSYEVIEFDLNPANHSLSELGDGWQRNNADHQKHLEKLISFYQAQLINQPKSSVAKRAVSGYQKILKKIQCDT